MSAVWAAVSTPGAGLANFLPFTSTVGGLSAYPAANYTRKYLWVSDLFGGTGDYVLSDGAYWKPVRPFATAQAAPASMVLQALVNAPTIIVEGNLALGVTANISFSSLLAYPGAKFRTVNNATGLGTLNVVGALTKALGLNAWADHEFLPSKGWIITASGGIL